MKWHFPDIWTESWVISGCYIDISWSGLGKDVLRGFQNKKHLMAMTTEMEKEPVTMQNRRSMRLGNPFLRNLALKVWRNNQKSLQNVRGTKKTRRVCCTETKNRGMSLGPVGLIGQNDRIKKANVTRTFLDSHVPHPFHREPSHFTSMHCSLNKYVGF